MNSESMNCFSDIGNAVKNEDSAVSCTSMKKAGFFKDEIYTLKNPNDKKARLAFCNMDGADGYENNDAMESTIGYVNHLPSSDLTVFSVYSNTGSITVGEYIHYDHFFVSSDTFDLKSGTFKAPFKGIYEFTITDHSYKNNGNYFSLKVEKNGSVVYSVFSRQSDKWAAHLSSSWILPLETNDQIRVRVDFLFAFSDHNCFRSFTGKLLEVL